MKLDNKIFLFFLSPFVVWFFVTFFWRVAVGPVGDDGKEIIALFSLLFGPLVVGTFYEDLPDLGCTTIRKGDKK